MNTTKKEILLSLDNVHVHYGGVKALNGATLNVDEGEVVALMGPNGAGKSTVLKAIFGIAPIETGSVRWREHKVEPVPHEMVERGIAFVPQGRRVFRDLTIEENLEIGAYVIKDKKEVRRRIEEVMDIFPILRTKRKAKSRTLSGGQQQMLAIARGLMVDPKILLLDEPSLGLSPKMVKEVFAKIKEINDRRKTAIVVVEHNIKSILEVVHRAYVLDKGTIAHHGSPRDILHGDTLKKVFLGK